MKPYCKLSLALAFWLQSLAAHALNSDEEDFALVYGNKSTTSIATGSSQPLRRAPAVASVITAADIEAMGATDLDQVLETVPGIHVSYGGTYKPLYLIRGIGFGTDNPQVLLLQNGVPMISIYTGDKGVAWHGLPLEHVARIEIIRGPGSALYGADAYAGVINIITKAAADIQGTEAGARIGSYSSKDAWLLHGGKLGPLNVAAYLRVGSTDGLSEIIERDNASGRGAAGAPNPSLAPGPVHAGYDAVDGNLEVAYDKWRLRAGYKLRDKAQVGAGVSQALDPVAMEKSSRITADLSWADPQFAPGWSLGWSASYLHYYEGSTLQLFPPGTAFGPYVFPNGVIGGPGRWENDVSLSGHAVYSGFSNHSLRMGAGHDDLDLYRATTHKNYVINDPTGATSKVFNAALPPGVLIPLGGVSDQSCAPPACQPHLLPHRRKVNYVYAQDEWRFASDWTFTGGARYDHYSDFGGTFNPRAAMVWDASLDLTVKFLFGRAFRAPSFNELYGINPVAGGNPKLKPESIVTTEAAFSWLARSDMQVNLNFFHYAGKDIIRGVPILDPVTQKQLGSIFSNNGRQHGKGLELEANWDASRNLRLTGNYAYQRSIDEATHTDAGYAPHHHLYARADWRFAGAWQASAQLNWVAGRKRAFGDARPDIADYSTLDLGLHTHDRGSGRWNIAASIRNLFNAAARDPTLAPGLALPFDLPVVPRTFHLQASYRF